MPAPAARSAGSPGATTAPRRRRGRAAAPGRRSSRSGPRPRAPPEPPSRPRRPRSLTVDLRAVTPAGEFGPGRFILAIHPCEDPRPDGRGGRVIRRDALREYSRGSLWFLPAVAAVLAILLGIILSEIPVGTTSRLAFQGAADDARSLLITIAGTMITVIALLLGLAVVALQLSSTQFSPRLLRNFLRDRTNQVVLSVFVGTFVYSAAGLFDVGIWRGRRVDEFPRLAVSVAIGLLFVSLALLVFFADHLAHSLQVDHIMRRVEQNALPVIRADEFTTEEDAPQPRAWAVAVPARSSGYVQAVECRPLLRAATQRRWTVLLHVHVGEHVVAGTVLAWAWSA